MLPPQSLCKTYLSFCRPHCSVKYQHGLFLILCKFLLHHYLFRVVFLDYLVENGLPPTTSPYAALFFFMGLTYQTFVSTLESKLQEGLEIGFIHCYVTEPWTVPDTWRCLWEWKYISSHVGTDRSNHRGWSLVLAWIFNAWSFKVKANMAKLLQKLKNGSI